MAKEISELANKTTPVGSDEIEIQETGGGTSKKATLANLWGNIGTLAVASGSITDSSGAITFDDENLSTTGTLAVGATTVTGGLTSQNGFMSFGTATELTLATGAVTAVRSTHTLDTEADAASDDLNTIAGGATGTFLILSAANSARTVVLKDGTGNLSLAGDFSLDNVADFIMLRAVGGVWYEISRSNNSS